MSKKIAIIGAGGHGKVVGEIAHLNNFKIINFFDDDKDLMNSNFPFKIKGSLNDLERSLKYYDSFFIAIGDNKIRLDKTIWLNKLNVKIINLIHPKSTFSRYSKLGKGICAMANSVVNPGVYIGDGVIINTSASIDHDCIINDYVHISPNCSLSGNVKVGKLSHIGTGSAVHPKIIIGANVKIGVGSKVFKNIKKNQVYKY